MISCPNCGGNLKFDIASQQLTCDHCHSPFDPYDFDAKTSDAEEEKSYEGNYEVTIFTCPQCGGEILSTDNAAAGFCSFCGASTILYSRISHEKRPNFIIPFKKTKEDCKNAYSAKMRHAIFAPKELKDPKYIDSFRGIYMPYWAFYLTQKGDFTLPAHKEYRRGDYIITDHYQLKGHVDAYYKGLSFDASSSFSDNISEQLAPYDVKGMKAFTPAYLSGFYADTADVDAYVYQPDAEDMIYEQTEKEVKKVPAFRSFQLGDNGTTFKTGTFSPKVESIDSTMFPVWFMSYRKDDRVAYVTVNGQTGKVVADIPVDPKKYVLGSLLLAIPIFAVLALFVTLMPTTLLAVSTILAILVAILYSGELSSIAKKDSGSEDRGALFRRNASSKQDFTNCGNAPNTSANRMSGTAANNTQVNTVLVDTDKHHNPLVLGMSIVLWVELAASLALKGLAFIGLFQAKYSAIAWCLITGIMAITLTIGSGNTGNSPSKKSARGFAWTGAAVILSAAIAILHPVSDLFYYGCIILTLIAIGLSFVDIIEHYNILSTRRLPQFDKKGGDDRA